MVSNPHGATRHASHQRPHEHLPRTGAVREHRSNLDVRDRGELKLPNLRAVATAHVDASRRVGPGNPPKVVAKNRDALEEFQEIHRIAPSPRAAADW
jgi:hypothetical protein